MDSKPGYLQHLRHLRSGLLLALLLWPLCNLAAPQVLEKPVQRTSTWPTAATPAWA